jgi:hypothetical protein
VSGTVQKTNPPATEPAKPGKPVPPPAPIEDNDINNGDSEDGDIATPKRDRYGTDDEPL